MALTHNALCFAERPWRHAPQDMAADSDIYKATPEERMATVQAALDTGITWFHAAHEREAVSLGESIKRLGVRDDVTLSTTDGDALNRCSDTETGAFQAVQQAIIRKLTLLQTERLDVFHLFDVREEVHTPARLAGAQQALDAARTSGAIRQTGATCYGDYNCLADALTRGLLTVQSVIARFNFLDGRAGERLLPVCRQKNIPVWAAQTYGWVGGVSFVRFPNTWRLRNMTQNFTGYSAGQLHLNWVLSQEGINGAVISMQSAAHVRENTGALILAKRPADIETLFTQFAEAITNTPDGWRGLLTDTEWEVRAAAEHFLANAKG